MKLAEPTEQDIFIVEHGFGELIDIERMPGKSVLFYNFEGENHTQSVYTIAKFLVGISRGKERTLVILENMFVWPSGRDEHLIKHAFASMFPNTEATFKDGTTIVWSPNEEAAACTLYHLALLFGWDVYIFPKGGGASAFISHDGFVELNTDMEPVEMAEIAKQESGRAFAVVGTQ